MSNLREIMEKKKVTILELAKITKLSSKTIERARGPLIMECRLSTLQTIANALGVKASDLYERQSNQVNDIAPKKGLRIFKRKRRKLISR